MDIALLPIGGYKPRKIHKPVHLDPADAIRAHNDLQATYSVAIHYGMFQLTAEDFDEPVTELKQLLNRPRLDTGEFLTPTEGHTILFKASSDDTTLSQYQN